MKILLDVLFNKKFSLSIIRFQVTLNVIQVSNYFRLENKIQTQPYFFASFLLYEIGNKMVIQTWLNDIDVIHYICTQRERIFSCSLKVNAF